MNIRIWMLAVCTLFVAACSEDYVTSPATGGKPVMAKLKISVSEAKEVTITRAGASHSEVTSLDIFVYNQGTFESVTTAKLQGGNLENDIRTYTIEFPTTSGKKTLLAIANGDDLSEWDINMEELKGKQLSLEEMKAEIISLQQNVVDAGQLPGFAALRMLLIGQEDVDIAADGSISGKPLALYRAAVEVTFEITNGSTSDNGKTVVIDFNPSTYQIFNVPEGTQIGSGEVTPETIGFYNTGTFVAPPKNNDMYSFTFYMPENIQSKGTNTTYNERDEWNDAGADATSADKKEWKYAPRNSTFVVITGAFNATQDGVLVETGMVNYTIHLGDFSTTTGSMNNYSVERNCSYKYKVKVNGVNNIIAEAEKTISTDQYQHSAEGGIIKVGEYTQDYTLDAHYEQVFLEYDITQMANDIASAPADPNAVKNEIGGKLLMIVETPFTKMGSSYIAPYKSEEIDHLLESVVMQGIDYKWVELYPQENDDELTAYPGQDNDKLINGYELSVALGKAIYDYKVNPTPFEEGERDGIIITKADNDHYVARFTAFVDEYYYTDSPVTGNKVEWNEFVNTDMRRMMLAMDVKISDDRNSQSVKLYSNISQRSMQTFYDLNKAHDLNGFGIEAFNETPGTKEYGALTQYGTSMGNGYQNTIRMLGGSINDDGSGCTVSGEWQHFVNWAGNGYMTSNTSAEPVASHKIKNSQPGDAILAYRACMSRNRDLNGNGNIDPEEVRWYMPAIHEYIRIALGSGAIASESQLYHGQKSDLTGGNSYVTNHTQDASMYYSSTSAPNLKAIHYWTVERGSYSGKQDYISAVRCIRHLPNPDGSAVTTPDPFYKLKRLASSDGDNYLLDYTGILQAELLRQTPQTGGYAKHNEDGRENRFYKGMVVAKDYLRSGNNNTDYVQLFTLEEVINQDYDVCANYSEKEDASDRGQWRVPNQSELTSLSSRPELFFPKENAITDRNNNNIYTGNNWGVLCRTQFSNQKCRVGFTFRGDLLSCPQSTSVMGGVRCVRDATETEMSTATEVTD